MEWEFKCPSGWQVVGRWGDGWACREREGGLRVLVDCEEKSDGTQWLHVSYSRATSVPTHDDTCKVERAFFGLDCYAYAVFPPSTLYVNIHPNCLHLWGRWDASDGRVLPEFSAILEGIGRSI